MISRLKGYTQGQVASGKLEISSSKTPKFAEATRREYELFEEGVAMHIKISNSELSAVQCDDCNTWRFMPGGLQGTQRGAVDLQPSGPRNVQPQLCLM